MTSAFSDRQEFTLKAKLKKNPEEKIKIPQIKDSLPLKVRITDPSLCPRFTAIIFDKVKVAPSPKTIQDRLEKVGIRALNNVVDISNYLMVELGQPMHTFDYDKIEGAKMILRLSKRGEKIVTLDGKERTLPAGVIVIEDADGSCTASTPVINRGDMVMISVNLSACFWGLDEREDAWGMISPEEGAAASFSFRIPASLSDEVYDIN